MIAHIAYLTSPAPDMYVLNFQMAENTGLFQIEISEGHLANIIADGAHYAFRKQCNRVPNTQTESANERTGAQFKRAVEGDYRTDQSSGG